MTGRITVRRIKLNRQGYEPGRSGRYFGAGEKLWEVEAETPCGDVSSLLGGGVMGAGEAIFRAPSYAAARKKAKALVEKAQAKCEAAAKTDWGRKKYGLGGRKRRRGR